MVICPPVFIMETNDFPVNITIDIINTAIKKIIAPIFPSTDDIRSPNPPPINPPYHPSV